ncbi:MAG: tyrosine--tRNA ligase [Deltaproteobacteria bacterium]|nr:tyrosine--tRNA ligase [Deltaproteobacteria bacterium]
MKNVFDELEERGFVDQATDPDAIRTLLEQPATCYIGFDPTAKSLHLGSLVCIMALAHMQRAGHRPIALVGGGTGLVGDPSGKTEMRRIMSREEIYENAGCIRDQLARFLDFDNDRAIMANNVDWLAGLNYIDFLRDIGRHFSVNRMLSAESYRMRLQTGLSFIEFNYMLLQSYDFLHLYRTYGCRLQMGGSDQWGNIVAGADLIRRVEGGSAFGITFPLITTASGIKMGKTHEGAVWLDPELTAPYDYYQYWINQDDADVARFLALFTFLPMDEVRRLASLEGADLRRAKEVLALEATRICHGGEAAGKAQEASRRLFGGGVSGPIDSAPTFELPREEMEQGLPAYILFEMSGLCRTRGDARRLIAQGGGYVNDVRIDAFDRTIDTSALNGGSLLLRAGKKRYVRVRVVDPE